MPDRYGSIAINADKPVLPSKKQNKPVPGTPDSPKKKKKKNSTAFFYTLIVFFFVTSYFLAGIYLAPLAIKKYLPQYVKTKAGLTLTIKDVQLNPINFQIILKQVEADLRESSASSKLLQVKYLFIDFDLTALIRNTFVCDKLIIKGLQLNLTRYKDKSYNIPALSHLSNAQEQGEIINFAQLPFLFSLNNIDITESRIFFKDQIADKTHTIENLQLAVPTLSNFSFHSEKYILPHFSAIINGSQVRLSGKTEQLARDQGSQTHLSCSIESMDLVPYFSYLPTTFPLTLSKGKADTRLQISFAPNKTEGSRLSIDINLTATDIELQEKNDAFRISVPAIKIDAVYAPISKHLLLKNSIAKQPHLTGDKKKLNAVIQKLFSRLQKKDTGRNKIDIDLLLIDQGRVTLLDAEGNKSRNSQWDSLELTIKDYSSTQTSGTIHLSGKQSEDKGSFSWQGKFKESYKTQGKLLLNDFPAAMLFKLLPSTSNDKTKGIATFSGDLVLTPQQNESVAYAFDNGMLQIHDLILANGKKTWLKADSVRLTRLGRVDGRFNLGNIFLKGSNLDLNTSELPPLFCQLFTNKNSPQIKGIDFSGTLNLKTDKNPKKPLELSNIRFQVNNLDKPPSADNFAFTGYLAGNGIIKTQGILHFTPTRMQADIAFSDINTNLLAPLFSTWPLLRNSQATLHGKGIYRFPNSSFQGNLRLTDSLLQSIQTQPLLTWNLAELSNITCRFSPFSLQAETLLLKAPEIQWQRESISPCQHIQKGMQSLFQNISEKNTLFPVTIKKINFHNGSIHILDKRLSPPWQTTVDKLAGRINNLDTRGNGLSSFTITGIAEDSPVTLSGTVAFFRSNLDARVRLKLTDFPLDSFSEQLKSTHVNPESAVFDLRLDITENRKQNISQGDMIIKNLTPASSTSDTALALAFLKDANGSFPLNVQLNDSSQSLFKESVANFKTTVIKSTYAPLLLDRKFIDLQDNNIISFQPGTNKISATGKEILSRYAELLKQHPELSLWVTGMADNKTDRAVLQKILEALEQQKVDKENLARLADYRKNQQKSSPPQPDKTLQEEDITKEDLAGYTALLPEAVQVKKAALITLAKERSLIVYDFCIHSLGVAVDRVIIGKKEKITENAPATGIQLSIKTMATDLE